MLRSLKELKGYVLAARDGEIGRCYDFLFDDHHWTVRYMVADTSKWLPGRKVLVSPLSLGEADWTSRRFHVELDREQIKDAPPLETDAPVTRRYEREWYGYYGWPMYWGGPLRWGPASKPNEVHSGAGAQAHPAPSAEDDASSEVRSMREVLGYDIAARDGSVGEVDDFIADDETWMLRYMVVDTRKWLPSKRVLFSTQWLENVDWKERLAHVALSVEQVKDAPAYDPSTPVNRELEMRTYDYYGRSLD